MDHFIPRNCRQLGEGHFCKVLGIYGGARRYLIEDHTIL